MGKAIAKDEAAPVPEPTIPEPAGEPQAAPVETPAAVVKNVKVTSAEVYAATGGLIRTYSAEDHGKNFQKLAQEFVDHTPGATITVR